MKRFLIRTEVDDEEEIETEEAQENISTTCKKGNSTTKKTKVGCSSTSGHAVGYNSKWEEEFPWLLTVKNDSGVVTGMLCRICKRHKTESKYNKSTVWSETPCTCIRKDSVRRHSQTLQHKDGVEKELAREQSSRDGGLPQAFQTQIALNKAAVKTAMQCLYWLVKEEIPHTTNYPSLLKAVEFMGCSQLKHLQCGENAKYTSRRITMEFLQVMKKWSRTNWMIF